MENIAQCNMYEKKRFNALSIADQEAEEAQAEKDEKAAKKAKEVAFEALTDEEKA